MRWGILGAAWVADRALLPAFREARGSEPLAIAARDPERARELAARHGVPRVHPGYEALLADPEVDAVYLPLPNSLHRGWTLRALEAGKHVLCEKPLALDAGEAREMAAAARDCGRLLMEAVMYRFHPAMSELVASLAGARLRFLQAAFGFPLDAAARPDNYRLRPELGGGALLDVGCYLVDLARWLLGEPEQVDAVWHRGPTGVDLSCTAVLGFPGGAQAALHASLECAEHQELVVVHGEGVVRRDRPFTAWRDPHDPYRIMVEAFCAAVLDGGPPPLPVEGSIATLEVLDRIRAVAGARPEGRPGTGETGAAGA
ncbi:MAG TPA: Gfo/Idh/MocA family oxidoreductase [Candidatus Dormibacteraeota bacterium]|nr:Gfo/Idh/MocA family oxidoreductase [Candidatus Dormibacteraeota bacterium]